MPTYRGKEQPQGKQDPAPVLRTERLEGSRITWGRPGFTWGMFPPVSLLWAGSVFLACVWRAGWSAGPMSWAVTCSSSWLTPVERAAGLH